MGRVSNAAMRIKKHISSILAIALSVLLTSCATQQGTAETGKGRQLAPISPPPPAAASSDDEESLVLSRENQQEPEYFVKEGTGVFINQKGRGKTAGKPAQGRCRRRRDTAGKLPHR